MITTSVLQQLKYSINEVKVDSATVVHLYLNGVRFKEAFRDPSDAWKYATQDLNARLRSIDLHRQESGPDYEGEAKKLGFEVTCVPAQQPRHGWRHRDLEVCSIRVDYPTAEEAWKSAYLWAKRFPDIFK